jgi:hypothetical protein
VVVCASGEGPLLRDSERLRSPRTRLLSASLCVSVLPAAALRQDDEATEGGRSGGAASSRQLTCGDKLNALWTEQLCGSHGSTQARQFEHRKLGDFDGRWASGLRCGAVHTRSAERDRNQRAIWLTGRATVLQTPSRHSPPVSWQLRTSIV